MEEDVVHGATERLFQYGVLGIFVVVFAVVISLLWKENAKAQREFISKLELFITKIEELQKSHAVDLAAVRADYDSKVSQVWQMRIQDKDAVQMQFTSLVKDSTIAMGSVVSMLESTKDTMSDVKETMKMISNDIRNRSTR